MSTTAAPAAASQTEAEVSSESTPAHPVPTRLLLVRHAVTGQTGRLLYGRMPGMDLSEEGRAQAAAVAERLARLPIRAIYASPVERAAQTAAAIGATTGLDVITDEGVIEVDAGDWTGMTFADLAKLDEWKSLQKTPSRAVLPGGESLAGMQARAVSALEAIARRHPGENVVVVSHRDPILAALAHYAGVHMDHYERMAVAPASVSVVELVGPMATIVKVNDTGSLMEFVPTDGGDDA